MLQASSDSVLAIARSDIADDIFIERLRDRDEKACEIIMRRYNQRLFRVARSILTDDDAAQDAMQQAYTTAFFKVDQYIPREGSSFAAWLTRITVNEALMIKRKQKADRLTFQDDEDVTGQRAPSYAMDPEHAHANHELAKLIEYAVDQLPEDFRTVFVLRAIQQLSVQDTAACLDLREATVKTRFHRARGLMQQELDQHIRHAGLHTFEFAGARCDGLVSRVLAELATPSARR